MEVGLVCDACSAFNEMGTASCISCRGKLSLDDAPPSGPEVPLAPASDDVRICGKCGGQISGGNQFCGGCGASIREGTQPAAPSSKATPNDPRKSTLFFSTIQAARAKLVLIKGEGDDGESYALAGEEHRIGRSGADIVFEDDPFLSPIQANFFYIAGKLVVTDEGSPNGVYIRIRGSRAMDYGDRFLVGEQVMQVCRPPVLTPYQPTEDGTHVYSSPRRSTQFVVNQILHGGSKGLAHMAKSGIVSLGREQNDINFPDDPFISGHHAQVSLTAGALSLTDLGSKNGTFLRITNETPLEHGDYVFMGQQLLRVEIL